MSEKIGTKIEVSGEVGVIIGVRHVVNEYVVLLGNMIEGELLYVPFTPAHI